MTHYILTADSFSEQKANGSARGERYERMQRCPDLFLIVFYSWGEFDRALSVSRDMLIMRKTLSLRDFPPLPHYETSKTTCPLYFFKCQYTGALGRDTESAWKTEQDRTTLTAVLKRLKKEKNKSTQK